MKLEKLLENVSFELKETCDKDIKDIIYDSRRVTKDSLFVATCGTITDGSRYINDAINSGACAIVTEKDVSLPKGIGNIKVKNSKEALGQISANFFNNPSNKMTVIGVTGTSGKTTVTNVIYSIYSNIGKKSGLIGTIVNKFAGRVEVAKNTTPMSRDLQGLFGEMVKENIEMCVLETSSHALDQGRVYGTEFNIGVFLNIARDHLDYHKTCEAYKQAKLKLFSYYPKKQKKPFIAVANYDEGLDKDIKKVFGGQVISFGRNEKADVYSTNENISIDKVEFDLNYKGSSVHIKFNMGGEFNVSNALAASAVAISDNISLEDIKKGIEACEPVNGRFQSVNCGQDFSVIVDYAHTPDEIEKLLITVNKIKKERIITVCGCGGNRDKGKRPIMGQIACDNSDLVFITSDNPRDEEPMDIIKDILEGIQSKHNYEVVCDRAEAIKSALKEAKKDDFVVIAGKGHEDYQIIKGVKYHFDDKEQVKSFLNNK